MSVSASSTMFLMVVGAVFLVPALACYIDSAPGVLRTGENAYCCVTLYGSEAKTSAFAVRVDEMSKLNFLNCESQSFQKQDTTELEASASHLRFCIRTTDKR